MDNQRLWEERAEYVDLLLYTKHHTVSQYHITEQSVGKEVIVQNIGVKGALKIWMIKKLQSPKLRKHLIIRAMIKVKNKLGIKLY